MESYISGGYSADIDAPDFTVDYSTLEALDTDISFDVLATQTEIDDLEAAFALPVAELPANHPEAATDDVASAGGTLAIRGEVSLEPIEDTITVTPDMIDVLDDEVTEEISETTETDLGDPSIGLTETTEPQTAQAEAPEEASGQPDESQSEAVTTALEQYAEPAAADENPAVSFVSHREQGSEIHDATTRATFAQVLEASGLTIDTASTYVTRGIDQGRIYTETINYAELAPGVVAIEDGQARSDGQVTNEVVIAESLSAYLNNEEEEERRSALLIVKEQQTVVTEDPVEHEVTYDTEYDLEWHGDDGAPMPPELLLALQNVYSEQPWQPTDLGGNPVTVEHNETVDQEVGKTADEMTYVAPGNEAFRLASQAVDAVRDTIEYPTVIGPNEGK